MSVLNVCMSLANLFFRHLAFLKASVVTDRYCILLIAGDNWALGRVKQPMISLFDIWRSKRMLAGLDMGIHKR